MKIDKDKAIKELLDSMGEEYIKGARAMLNYLRKEVTGCIDKNDRCSVCISGNKFLKQEMEKQK